MINAAPIKKLVIAYAAMTVGTKAGLSLPRALRMSVAIPLRKGNISMSIAPKAPGKRDPPNVIATCDKIVLKSGN